MRPLTIPLVVGLACPAPAQGEEKYLPFLDAEEAFAKAERENKRVLVYQDWPG